jgi:hypothetical protein
MANILKGVFGMNIGGMTANNPSWNTFIIVSVPGTVVAIVVVLCGKYLWTDPALIMNGLAKLMEIGGEKYSSDDAGIIPDNGGVGSDNKGINSGAENITEVNENETVEDLC